jgi:hypothetical protein
MRQCWTLNPNRRKTNKISLIITNFLTKVMAQKKDDPSRIEQAPKIEESGISVQ